MFYIADLEEEFYGTVEYKNDGSMVNALREIGCVVETFSYRRVRSAVGSGDMHAHLLEKCCGFSPDVIFIGYGDGIKPETIRMAARSADAAVVYWYGDASDEVEDWVCSLAGVADLFLCTTGGSVLEEYKSVSGCEKVAFFPNSVSPDVYKPLDKVPGSIVFTGGNYGEHERARSVGQLAINFPNDFKAYGWMSPRVKGKEYADVLGHADMGLAVSAHHDRFKMQSARTIEYMACGMCVFVKRVPGLERLVGFNNVVMFDDPDELPALVEAVKPVSRKIGSSAREWVERYLSSKHVMMYVLDELHGFNTSEYGPWVEVI